MIKSALGDIRSPWLLWVKGGLFVGLGLVSAVLVWLEHPTLKSAFLLAVTIWAFCRAYYFAFYVIEKYIDPSYRFAGLSSVVKYWWSSERRTNRP